MTQDDEAKVDGRIHGEQPDIEPDTRMPVRILNMILIWFMLSIAQTVLTALTVIQLVIMLVNNREPNARLSEFGTDLGIWIAKAARYQTAASEVKPWPWTDLD